jgi:hypothetical protein
LRSDCVPWTQSCNHIRIERKKKSEPIRIDSSLKDANQIQQAQYSTNFTERDGY